MSKHYYKTSREPVNSSYKLKFKYKVIMVDIENNAPKTAKIWTKKSQL